MLPCGPFNPTTHPKATSPKRPAYTPMPTSALAQMRLLPRCHESSRKIESTSRSRPQPLVLPAPAPASCAVVAQLVVAVVEWVMSTALVVVVVKVVVAMAMMGLMVLAW